MKSDITPFRLPTMSELPSLVAHYVGFRNHLVEEIGRSCSTEDLGKAIAAMYPGSDEITRAYDRLKRFKGRKLELDLIETLYLALDALAAVSLVCVGATSRRTAGVEVDDEGGLSLPPLVTLGGTNAAELKQTTETQLQRVRGIKAMRGYPLVDLHQPAPPTLRSLDTQQELERWN